MDPNATRSAGESLAIQPQPGVSALFRQATDVAGVCKDIVMKTVVDIVGRRYVKVEGWMAISVAHGCIASIRSVEKIPGEGVRAWAQIRRVSDQAVLAEAEGFVGVDEPDWYGGRVVRWNRIKKVEEEVMLPKRSDHAIRAMSQTRAISRVLRAGFSHVVVLIDAGLQTVPFEEVSTGRDDEEPETDRPRTVAPTEPPKTKAEDGNKSETPPETKKPPEVPRDEVIKLREQFRDRKWEAVAIHFGAKKDTKLGELPEKNLQWWIKEWFPKGHNGRPPATDDLLLRAALDVAEEETAAKK